MTGRPWSTVLSFLHSKCPKNNEISRIEWKAKGNAEFENETWTRLSLGIQSATRAPSTLEACPNDLFLVDSLRIPEY